MIQDDTRLCRNFAQAVQDYACDLPVCLFLYSSPLRVARLMRKTIGKQPFFDTHLRINEFCPVVGMIWPVEVARGFLRWERENPRRLGHPNPRSDDSVVGKWAAHTHQIIRFTAPSLVEHLGTEAPVKGGFTPASRMSALYFCEEYVPTLV